MRCRKCRAFLHDAAGTCPECGIASPTSSTIFDYIARGEEMLLAVALGAMVILVLVQIVLRYFFSVGIMGGSEIVRHLVLWVAFLGASLATRDGKHIRIELAQHLLSLQTRRLFDVITSLFSVIVCGILVWASLEFVSVDYKGGGSIAFFRTPVWILQLIIPVGYAAVALRLSAQCMRDAYALMKGDGAH